MLDDWITALTRELGLDGSVDEGLLLDVARDAAHNVARPAAPVTTFLVGLAAGRAGGSAGRRTMSPAQQRWPRGSPHRGRPRSPRDPGRSGLARGEGGDRSAEGR